MKIRSRPDAIVKLLSDLIDVLPKATGHFAAAINAAPEDREKFHIELHKAEKEADEQLNILLTKVSDTFITPFDREDVLSIAERFDDAVDSLDNTIELLVRFNLGKLPPAFTDCAEDLHEMAQMTATAVATIKKPKKFRKIWDEIDAVENRLDQRHNEIVADLLSGDYDVFTALKLKEIADEIEDTANLVDTFVVSIARTAIKET